MAKVNAVLQTPTFMKAVKKLKPNQKKGDLAFLRVYKFKMNKQLTLLGYRFDGEMLALGSHENFYQDIKYNI